MKIGIDARMYGAQSTTGIGVYIKKLIDGLSKIDQKNEYYIFLKEPAFSEFQSPANNFIKIKADIPWYSWQEQLKLPKILNRYGLDLMHFPHFNVPIFYRKKFIVTIHDITPKFFPGPNVKKSLIKKIAYRLVFKNAIDKSHKIITISQHTGDNLIKYFKLDKSKLNIIYPGVDQNFSPITNEEVLNKFKNKYNINKPFISYIGVWRDHKNLPGLISAFNQLKSEYKLDYQLVLAGKPDLRYPEIQLAINQSPFKNDIITPGFIPDQELNLFYSASKLFVLPSFAEGFGLVVIESLACGTPVAASSTTSLPEILGDNALYFNPAQSSDMAKIINKILTNESIYKKLAQSIEAESLQKYNWQDCAKKTLQLYENV